MPFIFIACALWTCVILGGCNGGQDEDSGTNTQDTPILDPRFASAENLIQYAKSLLDASEPDLQGYYQLFYWETTDQQIWRDYVFEIVVPGELLNQEVRRKFGASDYLVVGSEFSYAAIPNTQLSMNDGQRAQGAFIDQKQKRHTLQLVKVGERWWVSGYTIDGIGKELLARFKGTGMPFFREFIEDSRRKGHRQIYDTMISRIRSGEFQSADDAAAALELLVKATRSQ